MCLLAIFISSLEKCPLAHFFIGLFIFLELSFRSCLYIFEIYSLSVVSVQFSSVPQSGPTLCDPMNCSMPVLPVHPQHPEFTQTHMHLVDDAIQPFHPLSSHSPPVPNPCQHQSFSNESTLHIRWPNYWSFSFSIIPSKEIPGLISFRMDWLDLLVIQEILNSLLQTTFQKHQFFSTQFSTQSNSHIQT